jgi:signal transduction histidine kinase
MKRFLSAFFFCQKNIKTKMRKAKKLALIEHFLFGKEYIKNDFITKNRVAAINVFSALFIILSFSSILHNYIIDPNTINHNYINIFIVVTIGITYLHYRISNKKKKLHSYLFPSLLITSFYYNFYLGGEETALILFLLPILLLFLNKKKNTIIYFITLITITTSLRLFFANQLLLIYPLHFIKYFHFSFLIYLLTLIAYQVIQLKINKQDELSRLSLADKRLNSSLKKENTIQKKLLLQLSEQVDQQKETTRNLKSIINNTDDLLWIINEDYTITLFNNTFREAIKTKFGFDPKTKGAFKEFDNYKDMSLINLWRDRYQDVISSKNSRSYLDKEKAPDNTFRYSLTEYHPILKEGKVVGVNCSTRDITAQRTAKFEKEELTRLNSTIIASLGEIVYNYDFPKDEFTWNDAIYQVLGYNYSQMGSSLDDLLNKIHTDDKDLFTQEIEDLKEVGFSSPMDIRVLTSNNTYIWMQNRVNVIYNDQGEPAKLIGVLFDINDRKEIEINQLQAVVKGVDLERKRIAGEIHDGLGQTLIAASLILNSLEDDIRHKHSKQEQKRFFSVTNLINDAIEEGREMSHNIMPKSLEDYGLIPSIKSLVNRIKLSKKLLLDFHCTINEELRLSIEIENNLYRVVQESLNNIIKHSEAKNVVLQLVAHKRSIILTIEDDGKGFIKLENNDDSGLGLQNIKNRISSIGGNLQIDTHEGYGTLITIEVDIKE